MRVIQRGPAILGPEDVPNLLPSSFAVQRRSRQVIRTAAAATILTVLALASTSALKADEAERLRVGLGRARAAQQAREARAR